MVLRQLVNVCVCAIAFATFGCDHFSFDFQVESFTKKNTHAHKLFTDNNQSTHQSRQHTRSIDCAWFVYYSAEFIFIIQSVYAFIFILCLFCILNNDDCGLSFLKKSFFLCQLFVLCLLNEHFDNSFEFCLNFCFSSYKWMFNARIISFVSSPPILFFFARLNIHIFG